MLGERRATYSVFRIPYSVLRQAAAKALIRFFTEHGIRNTC